MSASRDLSPSTTVATPESAAPEAQWEAVGVEVAAVVAKALEPKLRYAADEIYDRLLYTAQEYLADNIAFNVGSQIDAANRQAFSDRKALEAERATNSDLMAALVETRRLVSEAAGSGFVDEAAVTALFVNNGAITHALAKAVQS